MQFTSTQKSTLAWCLIATLALLALWLLGPVLTPFVVAAVLAYALTPMVNKLDALGGGRMPRVLAVLIVQSLFGLILLSVLLLIVPIFAKELPLLREQLPLLQMAGIGPDLARFPVRNQVRYPILVCLHQFDHIPTVRLQFLNDLALNGTFKHHSPANWLRYSRSISSSM